LKRYRNTFSFINDRTGATYTPRERWERFDPDGITNMLVSTELFREGYGLLVHHIIEDKAEYSPVVIHTILGWELRGDDKARSVRQLEVELATGSISVEPVTNSRPTSRQMF